jgi:arabinogalactan oligomer/maltooligosaccharide transport system permease protein
LVIVPFVVGVGLAFMRHEMGTFTWVGLANFGQILSSEGYGLTHPLSFYFTLAVTIMWTAVNVCFHVGIGLALALVLQRPTLRFRGVYRVLLIVPWAVPSYITALIWKGMFDKQYGMINHVFGVIGIEPVAWFNGFWTAFIANVTTNTWLGFPFMMVVCLGALQSIPRDLYEAADVDGATAWDKFRYITLPLLKPALLPAVILGSVWTFNMFNVIYLVSNGQPHHSTDILITEAYRWAFEQDRYGYAAAYSVIIFLVLLSYSLLTQRVTKAAEEAYG